MRNENYEVTSYFRYSYEYSDILLWSVSLIHGQENMNMDTVHVSLKVDF
jgi:hypothetical protein